MKLPAMLITKRSHLIPGLRLVVGLGTLFCIFLTLYHTRYRHTEEILSTTQLPARTRTEVITTAEEYVNHEWRGALTNIFHGNDSMGIRIDTPDASWWAGYWRIEGWHPDGHINIGVPYCWGGESTISEFDEGVKSGRPAGYVFKTDIRPDGRSSLPLGVDCSGFVTRCWGLKQKQATNTLSQVSTPLPNYDELRPGDIVNKPYSHVIIFKEFIDEMHAYMLVYEADIPKVRERVYNTYWLRQNGFLPFRYLNITEP